MTDHKERIQDINNNYLAGHIELAWELYAKLLEEENAAWKIPKVKKLAQSAQEQNLVVLLSINFCDLVLVDFNREQVFFVSISSQKFVYDHIKAYMKWLELNRKVFSEDITDDLGYKTRVLLVINAESSLDSEITNYEHDNFLITRSEDFLSKIAGGPNPVEMTKHKRDVFEYCQLCANELTDIVFKAPQKVENTDINHLSMPSNFKLKDYAPDSYVQFVERNHNAIRGLEFKKILQLSLNFALLDVDRNILKDVVTHFYISITDIDGSSDKTEVHFINAAAPSLDDFKKNLKEKRNGILIIKNLDEAVNVRVLNYSKQEQLDMLCSYMEQNNENIIILSLSRQNWMEFVAINPMLPILFQHSFTFEPLSVKTLEDYFWALLEKNNYSISKEGRELCVDFFNYSKNNLPAKAFTFTLATVLFREACYYHAIRTAKDEKKDNYLQSQDIQRAVKDEYTPSDTESLSDVMADLNQLIGLENVKTSISDLAALVKIDRFRNKIKPKVSISLNALFTGNPGTGKTTVAQMLGRMYKSIGALKSGHLVAVGRQDIVGLYIGDTEKNMKDIIAKAHGGVLFIDEAYSLYKSDSPRDFGIEAINVLVDSLEKIREHTCVVLAGYPKPMAEFLTANEGLSSRFPHNIEFEDYDQHQLYEIFLAFMKKENMEVETKGEVLIREYLNKTVETPTKYFGNARDCRNLFEKLKLIQARRLAALDPETENLYLIKEEDVANFLAEKPVKKISSQRPQIGFATNKT